METKRTILCDVKRKELDESLKRMSFISNKDEFIKNNQGKKIYIFQFDILGFNYTDIHVVEPNAEDPKYIYSIAFVNNQKFDSGSETIKGTEEKTVLNSLINGLATFLVVGVGTLFMLHFPQLEETYFEEEMISHSRINIKTSTPINFIILDETTSNFNQLNINWQLFEKKLISIEETIKNSTRAPIRIIPLDQNDLDDIFKIFTKLESE